MTELEPASPSAPRRLLRTLGVNRAVGYTLLNSGWSLVSQPVTLLLTVTYLTPGQQGYSFTFGSILAIQIFFELGIGFVVQQCVSHEFGKLHWADDGTLAGDAVSKARLASLFRQAVWWYAGIGVLVAAAVGPAGYHFFRSFGDESPQVWAGAWGLTVIAAVVGHLAAPVTLLLNGAGRIAATGRVSAVAAIVASVTCWIMLYSGAGLLAAPLGGLLGVSCVSAWLVGRNRRVILDLWSHRSDAGRVQWLSDVWPFQWRMALSWLSGYFILQLFNPIAFAFGGEVVAGQLGLSLRLMTQIHWVAIIWVNVRMPQFGQLIAQGHYAELDAKFSRAFWVSTVLVVAGLIAVIVGAFALQIAGSKYAGRMLPPLLLILIAGNVFVQHVSAGLANYLRAHRQEPFLLMSIVVAILTGASTYTLGRYAGVAGMLGGFLMINIFISLPWAIMIFINKRRAWHGKVDS